MYKRSGIRISVMAVLLILFLVVILPMYLFGYGIYQWGYQMVTNEITQSLQTRASFFLTALDTELRRIRKVHQECLNDKDLYYYVNASSILSRSERLSSLLSIEKRLGLVQDSSAYIEEVTLWMPRIGQMISTTHGVDPATDNWRTFMDAPYISRESGLSIHEGNLYLCAAFPPGVWYPGYVPQYILAIKLSNKEITAHLASFNLYPDGGTLLQSADRAFQLKTGKDIGVTDDKSEEGPSVHTFSTDEQEVFLRASVDSDYLNLQLHTFVSERIIYGKLDIYRNLFILFTGIALVLILAFFWFSRRLVSDPIRQLVDSLKQVESGRLDVRINHKVNNEFAYLYTAFNQMVESLADMLKTNARQLMLTQEAELRQLQAQINPHFLHNSFFILYRMAKDEDYENITEFLTHLSEYYRYVTRNANMEVDLSEEDGHARRYVQIQLVRFGKRISADFAPIPEGLGGLKVPRLILQPLLENAFRHGFNDTISGGLLRVWYEEKNEKVFIHVQDNGAGIAEEYLSELRYKLLSASNANVERSGIMNIHQRLRIRFGIGYGLTVENLPEGGSRFTLVLPKNAAEVKHVSSIGG